MQCAACGEMNRDGARFCDNCGAALNFVCPQCAAELRPHARFCDHCGYHLQQTRAQAGDAAAAPEKAPALRPGDSPPRLRERRAVHGERRIVTVMFVDTVDHTRMSEQLGEETMYDIVQGCYDRMREAAHRYDGTVQFTGDGIFALFGAPVAYEDSARRAVATAVEIRRRLESYAEDVKKRHQINCRYRIGLNTGPVVVGNITDDRALEYTAVGDTVNLASRMETLAEPGEIYMTEATFKAVRDYYECERVGDLKIKGKQRPVTAYRVVREKPVHTRIEAAASRGLTPYTGREQELNVLQSFWKQAEQGRGQVALISGEAGIGKSRLLFEFRHQLEGEHVLWMEGQCTSFGENVAYLPFINFLKKSFGIREGDDERAMQDKIRDSIADWDEQSRRAIPYLRYLLNLDPEDDAVMKMDPMERRAGIIDSYRLLMRQISKTQPLVLVVEDLHWIDRKSLELLEALVDSVSGQPVLMILTHRPEFRHSLGERSFVSRIALVPLTAPETCAMACGLLHVKKIDAALEALIQKKTEGNPFYVEEVTRSLMETGALRRSNGSYALSNNAADVHVPDSIQEIILARLDRLDGPAREALQVASVIGREFTGWLVERLTQAREAGGPPFNELKALELIHEHAYFPELSYMFKHALTHEVAYSTLLLTRRRSLHKMVATVIEELYADRLPEQYEMLARHYCEAEEWDKALEYLEKAGDKSIANYANQEALQFFAKILDICERIPGPAYVAFAFRAGMQRGWVNFLIGRYLDAVADMNRIIATARNHGDAEIERTATLYRGWFEKYAHEFEQCEETLKTIVRSPDDKLDSEVAIGGAMAFYAMCKVTNRHEEAEAYATALEPVVYDANDPITIGHWKVYRALDMGWRGRYADALAILRREMRVQHSAFPMILQTYMSWTEGLLLGAVGQYRASIEKLRRVIADNERMGEVATRARAMNTLGWVYTDLQDYARAAELNHEGIEVALLEGPEPEKISNARLNIADGLIAQGRYEEAEKQLAPVLEVMRNPTPQDRWMLWRFSQHALMVAAELALVRGDSAEAIRFLDECDALAGPSSSVKFLVKSGRLRGRVHLAEKDLGEAARYLDEAVSRARTLGHPPERWRTLLAAADVSAALGDNDRYKALRAEARAELERALIQLEETPVRDTFRSSALFNEVVVQA